jgi:hypothetical protein
LREEAYPNAIAAGLWEGEVTLTLPDGGILPVSQRVMAHHNDLGQVEYLSTVARDISDRKRAEAAAQAAALREMNFANILINGLPGIFYLLDRDCRFLRRNRNLDPQCWGRCLSPGRDEHGIHQTGRRRPLPGQGQWPQPGGNDRSARQLAFRSGLIRP